jgi:hypothetical protein
MFVKIFMLLYLIAVIVTLIAAAYVHKYDEHHDHGKWGK